MSLYDSEVSNIPGVGYNPYRYAQLHPSPEAARIRAKEEAEAEAIKKAEGDRILARLRERESAYSKSETPDAETPVSKHNFLGRLYELRKRVYGLRELL
jgi:hypothetical protein